MTKLFFSATLLYMLALANSAYTQVIYEIYPGGGGTGSTYYADAVVLQGPPGASLVGKSLQYQTATGTGTWGSVYNFPSGSVFNAGGYFYIQLNSAGTGAPFPFTPNVTILSFSLSQNGGKVALVKNTTALSGCPSTPNANVDDLVGYSGSNTANCSETAPEPFPLATALTASIRRTQETNNNSADFVLVTTPLPIELTYFEATPEVNSVTLRWQTATERGNASFILERSADGVAFQPLGTIAGANSSNESEDYQFIDESPLKGINYYRLLQMDVDGRSSYSGIVRATTSDLGLQLSLSPNPAKGLCTLSFQSENDEWVTLQCISPDGRIIEKKQVEVSKGKNELLLDVSTFPKGLCKVLLTTETNPALLQSNLLISE